MSFMDNDANVRSSGPNPVHPGGKKVTTTHAPSTRENPGPIAADSLAADSTRAHGAFAHNKNAEPLSVLGPNSTFATVNTTAAETLPPTQRASARHTAADTPQHPGSRTTTSTTSATTAEDLATHRRTQPLQHPDIHPLQYPARAATATPPTTAEDLQTHRRTQPLPHHPDHPTHPLPQPPPASPSTTVAEDLQTHRHTQPLPHDHHSNDSSAMNVQPKGTPGASASPGLLAGNAAPAPTYVDPVLRDGEAGGRPKGKNLTEVKRGEAFEGGEGKNVSFDGEIGTAGDPGRLAEQRMREGAGAGGLGEMGKEGEGRFAVVGEESA